MKRLRILILLLLPLVALAEKPKEKPKDISSLPKHIIHRLYQVWTQGNDELYFTGYAWHNRYTYKINIQHRFNELAWGGGFGKGFFDEDGDWHGLYAMAFLDSHKNLQPTAGYGFLKVIHLTKQAFFGGGFTLLATSRQDINHSIPIPGILPLISLRYGHASIYASYVPGTYHTGNVLFVFGKWTFKNL